MKKRFGILVVLVSMCMCILAGCSNRKTQVIIDLNNVGRNDVFSINGTDCTKDEARLYLCNYQNIYGSAYGLDLWQYDYSNMDIEVSLEDYVKELTLVELSHVICMNLLAEELEIFLTPEEEKLVSEATAEYYESLSKEEIRYMGIDKTELKDFYERYALAQKVYKSLTEGVNEEVSDDEARVIHIQQIYVKNANTANEVAQKLQSGSGFETIASSYSEADEVERSLKRGDYEAGVEHIAFNLDDGEVSGMIGTEDGYYFIKCLDKFDEELTEANKENIILKRRQEQFDTIFYGLINDSAFELNEKVWNSVKVDTSGAIKTDSFFDVYEKYFTE